MLKTPLTKRHRQHRLNSLFYCDQMNEKEQPRLLFFVSLNSLLLAGLIFHQIIRVMRKQILVFISITVLIYVASSSFTAASRQGGFKNLKVLPKDISKDSLDAIMDYFKASLGVKCNFCHAPDPATNKLNFASDDKPEKEIARAMMKMTSEINKNYFNFNNSNRTDTINAVTCYTCHNGNPHPEAKVNMDKDEHHMPANHPPVDGGQMPPPDSLKMKP